MTHPWAGATRVRPVVQPCYRYFGPSWGHWSNGEGPLFGRNGTGVRCVALSGYRHAVPRKKLDPVDLETRRTIGALLRELSRAAAYRAVHHAAAVKHRPAAHQATSAY